MDAFNKPFQQYDKKTATDPVTETDRAVEEYIKSTIQKHYPDHEFVGEETSTNARIGSKTVPYWICDPIDGTANFCHKLPYCAVCIAVCIENQLVSGVVYAPLLDELYSATYNSPAMLNGSPISVSKVQRLSEAAVCTELGSSRDEAKVSMMLSNLGVVLGNNAQCIRMLGSCALAMCMVAAGRIDIYYEWGPHIWDFAAGRIIVERAGGQVLDPSGDSHSLDGRAVFASNAHLVKALQLRAPTTVRWL